WRESKTLVEIPRGLRADLFCGHVAQFADLTGYLPDKRRLVALAAMRNRGQVGRVGFDQHAVERNHLRRVADRLRLGKGDIAGKRNHETQIERPPRMLDASREAVQNAAQSDRSPVFAGPMFSAPMFGDHAQAVVPCVLAIAGGTAMNDDGQLRRSCQLHLLPEDRLLYFTRRVIVEIVEADLSPGDYLGMPR